MPVESGIPPVFGSLKSHAHEDVEFHFHANEVMMPMDDDMPERTYFNDTKKYIHSDEQKLSITLPD